MKLYQKSAHYKKRVATIAAKADRRRRRQRRREFQYVYGKSLNFADRAKARSFLRSKRKSWNNFRKRIFREVYAEKKFDSSPESIMINAEIGIEKDLESFLQLGSQIIDTQTAEMNLSMDKCNRFWPSAVMMLASLVQWVTLRSSRDNRIRIRSSNSRYPEVNSYLDHCGFYDYVKRLKPANDDIYSAEEVVKIRREGNLGATKERHFEIKRLLETYADLDPDQIEMASNIILSEILINVTEHGVYDGVRNNSFGWFALAQYHKTTKILSVNIADNGLGFKNTLISGPQRKSIISNLGADGSEDQYIQKAFEPNISGAVSAEEKKGNPFRQFPRGSRRGQGLKRIRDTCAKLGIELTIVSHYGCVQFDGKGRLKYSKSNNKRVFGGTLYHLRVPARDV